MNILRTLFLLAASLSLAPSTNGKSLYQFRNHILCLMPNSWPIRDYADYGCYCGNGGRGTPVDELDRCCEVHDNCYCDAIEHPACWSIFHSPYVKLYSYNCATRSKIITCGNNNNACEMIICECDRKAAECFARSPYIDAHWNWPQDRC
ncbi:unnamed protein product [Pleuronectes platessa]|uniref:Phospholipase A2 n=1 Tax=Pleuronectes platessa TaxID=8262 RepID=A0A9N7U8G4_PLEPL|nr:unnamed protein product [Pleuronectes platessa]